MALRRSGYAIVACDRVLHSSTLKLVTPGCSIIQSPINLMCDSTTAGLIVAVGFGLESSTKKRQAGSGALYRLDPDGTCHEMVGSIAVANGIAWSPEDLTMYFADSCAQTVFSFAFDPELAHLCRIALWREFPTGPRSMQKDSCGVLTSTAPGPHLSRSQPARPWEQRKGDGRNQSMRDNR
jgi:hypothetical protein